MALMGVVAFVLMLAVYFGAVSLVSGSDFTLEPFADFWHFIIALALGFGIQVGLYADTRGGEASPRVFRWQLGARL